MYLRGKDPTDYTMQEGYVAKCLTKEDTTFFPVLRTRKLEAYLKQDVGLSDLQSQLGKIAASLLETQSQLAKVLAQ